VTQALAASVNGVVVPPEQAVVPVYDRGFLFGDGVFETIRAYSGRPFALGEHMTRLARSAAALRITMPVPAPVLAREVDAVLTAWKEAHGEGEASVRVMLTRGGAAGPTALVPAPAHRATRVILVQPLASDLPAIYANGLRTVTLTWGRAPDVGPAAAAKLLPYVTSFLAIQEATARGADDAIFVDGYGRVREAATSNVFVVREDGVLATPPDGPGVLAGITRTHVLDLACTLGLSSAVCAVTVSELTSAREVFLTSSLREVAPVVKVDGHVIGGGAPGNITRTLHRALRVRAGAKWLAPWE
jgi:branched-chain amino acid aminotransferase